MRPIDTSCSRDQREVDIAKTKQAGNPISFYEGLIKYLKSNELVTLSITVRNMPNKKANNAVNQLKFSNKRISYTVLKVLNAAIANAENNHGLDVDKLFVKEAFVGKGLVMKRLRARARGRAARILKPFSHLSIIVHEKEEENNGSES